MFTMLPLRNSAQSQRYYAVLSASGANEHLSTAPLAATLTPPRWHGECRGLSKNVTEHEFNAVSCSRDIRFAYAFAFSPSLSMSQTYERILQKHDWHHSQLILEAIENATNYVMQELQSAMGHLVWASSTARWQRGDRQGICWNTVLFDISSAQIEDRRKRSHFIRTHIKTFDTACSEALTKYLTTAWPEWRNATG
jgi:hypothetical protein